MLSHLKLIFLANIPGPKIWRHKKGLQGAKMHWAVLDHVKCAFHTTATFKQGKETKERPKKKGA